MNFTGDKIYKCGVEISKVIKCGDEEWEKTTPTPVYSAMPLTFEFSGPGYLYFKTNSFGFQTITLVAEYSKDNGATWTTVSSNTSTQAEAGIPVQAGDTVQWRGTNSAYSGTSFITSSAATHIVYGNILSLLYGDNYQTPGGATYRTSDVFYRLFYGNMGLKSAEHLILPKDAAVTDGTYRGMFELCRNMTTPPEIVGRDVIGQRPLKEMFKSCSSLNFIKCMLTSLSSFPPRPQEDWVYGVHTTGTFVCPSSMVSYWENLRGTTSGIPEDWTLIGI